MKVRPVNKEEAELAFEQLWARFCLNKTRLSGLSEKDKGELKVLMQTIFMSSLDMKEAAKEFHVEMHSTNSDDIKDTVRDTLKEEMGTIRSLIQGLQTTGARTVTSQTRVTLDDEPVILHESMFDADMVSNLDDIEVESKDALGVSGSLEALRNLRKDKKQ